MTQKSREELSSFRSSYLPVKKARYDSNGEDISYSMKLSKVQKLLERLYQSFPHSIDESIFKEWGRITAILEADFVNQRSSDHLAKLAYSIFFIKKKITRDMAIWPMKEHHNIRVFPSSLRYTFGSKPVLGILAHVYLENKYEAFDEDHILQAVRKSISEAQLVKGSVYIFQASKNGIKTLYLEIDKKSGLPFSSDEIKRLRNFLRQEVKFCIEQLVPRIFMTRNEEEILRNILTLSREIHQPTDLPQVMIMFDQQTSNEAIFTIILIRVGKESSSSLAELFSKVKGGFVYVPERCQIVRYLGQNHPVEANVFRISLAKDPSLMRADLSFNFYLARQKISKILAEAVGEFRDFNGGIILKQREALSSFMDDFLETSLQDPDLLENFFYSLSPIEVQATLPMTSIKSLFRLFLEAIDFKLGKTSDYFLKAHKNCDQLFIMIRIPDSGFKDHLDSIFASLKLTQSKNITLAVPFQNSYLFGYLIESAEAEVQDQFLQAVTQALTEWKQKLEHRQILTLGLEHPMVSLDPRIGGDHISSLLLKLLFEGLMRKNRDNKMEYGVAKSVDISSDLKTYIFYLRSTRWSNGSLVSAFDFEYAWKKILSPTFKTPFAYLFYPIKNAKFAKEGAVSADMIGVRALDDFILKVELNSPTPYFLELTTHPIYSPVHRVIDQLHPNWVFEEKEAYVCNGAFQLSKNSTHEGFEFTKNLLYSDVENIKLDQIMILRTNPYQAYEMFHNHHNHWVGVPLVTWDPNFSPRENDEQIAFSNKRLFWYTFNCQKPPFNHKKMRQAFALGIDKQKLAAILNTTPASSPLPAQHTQLEDSVLSTYEPEQAKLLFREALEELGISHRDLPLISMIHLAGPVRSKASEFIQKQWEALFDIRCSCESLEWDDLFLRMTAGNFNLGAITWNPWVDDPLYTLNAFRDAEEPVNFAKWENTKYQHTLHQAEREVDPERRRTFYLQAEQQLIEEMPIACACFLSTMAYKKKNLKICCPSTLVDFKWAYFDSP